MLKSGELEDREVEVQISTSDNPVINAFSGAGLEGMGLDLGDMLKDFFPKRKRKVRLKVAEARKVIESEEAERLMDQEKVTREALERTETTGIVFLDELDKVVSGGSAHGPDVSREGVQRDLLPLVEGTRPNTVW